MCSGNLKDRLDLSIKNSWKDEKGYIFLIFSVEELNDNYDLGAFRSIVDKIYEQRIRIFLSIIKDTYLTWKIKKSRGAMLISLAKAYARKNNINLNFK